MQKKTDSIFNPGVWRQTMFFAGCYWLLNYFYFLIPDDTYRNVVYHYGVVIQCAGLINAIAPLEQVAAVQNFLQSSHANLEIIRGCDSAGVLFLLISAILVYPSGLSRKVLGLVYGIVLIYLLNLLRLIGLYFLIAYHREWFEFVHLFLAPTLMIIGVVIFFAWWAMGSQYASKSA